MEYVFVTGMGRSGTKFLTALLGSIDNVNSVHEYIGNREYWLLSWYLPSDVYAKPYLERQKVIVEEKFKNGLFIDINGYLQNSVSALESTFNPRKIFHFVRDPREVVRSIYTRRDDADIHLIPKSKTEVEKWLDGDKFTQICWNWASTTEQLLQQNTELILFEKIKSDFVYFNEKILIPLDLKIEKSKWESAVEIKVNKTRAAWYRWLYAKAKSKTYMKDELPPFQYWPENKKQQFIDICGSTMKKCGYQI